MQDAGGRQVRYLENQIADLRNQLESERARGEQQVWMMLHSKKTLTCSNMFCNPLFSPRRKHVKNLFSAC